MEILAVLLVIAVVVSMAVPGFRAVRYEVKNSQAKAAAKKFAEAMRSYYQHSRGQLVESDTCFSPTDISASGTCSGVSATGIPHNTDTTAATAPVRNLFSCGYLPYKEFARLPYRFCPCNPTTEAAGDNPCAWVTSVEETEGGVTKKKYPFVVVVGAEGAGKKFKQSGANGYYLYVDHTMTVHEHEKTSD